MPPQVLDRPITCYRIGDPNGAFPIFSDEGARKVAGRWNDISAPMVYTSENYSTAMLEKLVHGSGHMPKNQHFIRITIPNGLSYEQVTPVTLPGWESPAHGVSRPYGSKWQRDNRSALLLVPSVVARMERNILINLEHPEAAQIAHDLHEPVWWDDRLFS